MRIIKSSGLGLCHRCQQLIKVIVFQTTFLASMYLIAVTCISSQSMLLLSLVLTMKFSCGRDFSGLGNSCRNRLIVSTFDAIDSDDEPCLWAQDLEPNEIGVVELEGIDRVFVVELVRSAIANKGINYVI
jgi:hypothetical protein